jgi:hypothetical protein
MKGVIVVPGMPGGGHSPAPAAHDFSTFQTGFDTALEAAAELHKVPAHAFPADRDAG